MQINRVNILGVPIFDGTIEMCISKLNFSLSQNKNLLISATGAHGLIETVKCPPFKSILDSFYLNLPDGQPNVWVSKLKGAKYIERCYGPEFFQQFLISTASKVEVKHFFCGGVEGVALELKEAVKLKFRNENVVGTYCPPFLDVNAYDYSKIARAINSTNASVVWIGLSTPKQEEFAYHLSKHTEVDMLICVGAAFDFHTDRLLQAPSMIQKLGLEWLFRLLVEPKRLFKRYIEIVPKFIFYVILDLLKLKTF